jgi:hypothetical protein
MFWEEMEAMFSPLDYSATAEEKEKARTIPGLLLR